MLVFYYVVIDDDCVAAAAAAVDGWWCLLFGQMWCLAENGLMFAFVCLNCIVEWLNWTCISYLSALIVSYSLCVPGINHIQIRRCTIVWNLARTHIYTFEYDSISRSIWSFLQNVYKSRVKWVLQIFCAILWVSCIGCNTPLVYINSRLYWLLLRFWCTFFVNFGVSFDRLIRVYSIFGKTKKKRTVCPP